jgi:hypothetical protein
MPDFSRRSIILGTAGVAAAGAGVTAAASGLSGSVEGQADVEAEQALTVTDIVVNSNGDQDADFTRVADDNTAFQAAVELNNGDEVRFDAEIRNNAADKLDVQIQVDSPDVIDIAVGNEKNPTAGAGDDNDANVDDANADDGAIKTGEDTYIATISSNTSPGSQNSGGETITIDAELDDTADPGSYDIGVAINPLSTGNNNNS